jgi:hypothetical protein
LELSPVVIEILRLQSLRVRGKSLVSFRKPFQGIVEVNLTRTV